jgi:hypothetical protein
MDPRERHLGLRWQLAGEVEIAPPAMSVERSRG